MAENCSVSVLQNWRDGRRVRASFPALVIEGALPEALYTELESSFPHFDKITGGAQANNKAFHYPAHRILNDRSIPAVWRDFAGYHASHAFARDLFSVFGSDLRQLYPRLRLPSAEECGVRSTGKYQLNLDCQIAVNSPVSTESTVIGPHLDSPIELYAGLLYMRHPEDDFRGGDLAAYAYRDRIRLHGARRIRSDLVKQTDLIPYRRNVCVFFINSLRSAHGVTPRSVTPRYRRYVNIIGEVRVPLFNDLRYTEGLQAQFRRPVRRAKIIAGAALRRFARP